MEQAIEKLSSDIIEFLDRLHLKRKAYEKSMDNDEVLAHTRKILAEIRDLEKTIVDVVEKHFKGKKS